MLDGVGMLPLRRRDGTVRAWAVVDLVDFAGVSCVSWSLLDSGYVMRASGGVTEYLHRRLLGLERGDPRQADHRNRNPLDNRRANLRIATHAQNSQNVKPHADARSAHRGVSWEARRGKWLARGMVNGRAFHIGRFDDEEEAAAAAAAWRREHMPYAID